MVKEELMPLMHTVKESYGSYFKHSVFSSQNSLLLIVPFLDAVLEFGILDELDLHA